MYIRCAGCARSSLVWPAELEQGVACVVCGYRTVVHGANDLGSTSEERFRRARDFASEKGIDLASAYSVLLGLLPLEEALPIHLDDRYDPAFDDAIQQGFMTVQQAIERGDRASYASTLQHKHGLTMDQAFQVADNKLRLAEALAPQPGDEASALSNPHHTRGVWNIVQVAVAFVIAGAGTVAVLRTTEHPAEFAKRIAAIARPFRAHRAAAPAPPEPPAGRPEAVAFKTDAHGRVTEVSGPDPKTVLVALCKHAQFAPTLSPVGVVAAIPPSTVDRLGFVHDVGDPSAKRCVGIHLDAHTGRWYAGDGREPLEIQRAPALTPETSTTPL